MREAYFRNSNLLHTFMLLYKAYEKLDSSIKKARKPKIHPTKFWFF